MRRHLLLLAALLGATARAEAAPEAWTRQHQLSLYGFTDGMVYLSEARTIGGAGGGVGVRDTVQDRFIFQADVSYLMVIGNTFAVRLGAGIQRSGLYTPAIFAVVSSLFGEQFMFLTPAHPTAVTWPTLALGVNLAPLRFTTGQTQISLVELGVSAGTDLPGLGVQYHVNLIDIGTRF